MSNDNKEFIKNFSTGYYILGYKELQKKENKNYKEIDCNYFEDGDNPYDYADVFFKGSCDLFAIALQKKYGYLTLKLQTKINSDAHYFCKSKYNGKDVYIDVRGITTDLNRVISEFMLEKDPNIDICSLKDEASLSKAEKEGLKFAEQIINENPQFYDVNKLQFEREIK